ncbi:MAG: hypothetical protein CMB76_05555 [Euryarchaeota archaeon]|nr:hypothetical protein [Euryarchaeota archaeon]
MTIYYLKTHETYNRDYKVEANSKKEAIQLVRVGMVDHCEEWLIKKTVDRGSVKTEKEVLFSCAVCGFYPLVFEDKRGLENAQEYDAHPDTGEKYCYKCALKEFPEHVCSD